MTTFSRDRVRSSLRDQSVSVDALEADPRSAGAGLGAADLDGDGRIAGEREVDAVYAILDRRDGRRDGRVRAAGGPEGATPAAPLLDALADAARAPSLRSGVSLERAVVVVGMTDTAREEAAALRRHTPVLFVGDVAARLEVAGRARHDLENETGRAAFVRSLGVPDPVARGILDVLRGATPGGRRELAELASIWAAAERDETAAIPRRLLLSGHGDARRFFGDDHDEIRDSDLIALARAMPRAAARIEALHLAACQHGYGPRLEAFRAVMPNLSSQWGYTGFSPSGRAAQRHQEIWERQTERPSATGARVHREHARGTHRGSEVSTWTRARGFEGLPVRELSIIMGEHRRALTELNRHFSGEIAVADPYSGPVVDAYQRLQEIANHPDFDEQSDTFREHYDRLRDACLRLRFFTTHVTRQFDAHYRAQIVAGYRALGIEPPRFEGMSRREALAEVARFQARLTSHSTPPREARELQTLLREGLVELRASVIPVRWL